MCCYGQAGPEGGSGIQIPDDLLGKVMGKVPVVRALGQPLQQAGCQFWHCVILKTFPTVSTTCTYIAPICGQHMCVFVNVFQWGLNFGKSVNLLKQRFWLWKLIFWQWLWSNIILRWYYGTGSLNHLPTRAPLESAVLISVDSRPTHENPIKPPPHWYFKLGDVSCDSYEYAMGCPSSPYTIYAM